MPSPTPDPVISSASLSVASLGALTNAPVNGLRITAADLTPPNPRSPNQVVNNPSTVPSSLRFPEEVPVYYMLLDINQYSRSSWESVGDLQTLGNIALPLPQQLVDASSVKFEEVAIGGLGGLSMNALGAKAEDAAMSKVYPVIQDIMARGAAFIGGTVDQGLGLANQRPFLGGLIASGMAINSFMTLMLSGPTYKVREFTWLFHPQTAQETQQLTNIIAVIKNAQAPTFSPTAKTAFWNWPRIFTIKFKHILGDQKDLGPLLFEMKPMVLTDFVTNYTPTGTPSFLKGSSGPIGVEVRARFTELEYWISGDYKGGEFGIGPNLPSKPGLIGGLFGGTPLTPGQSSGGFR